MVVEQHNIYHDIDPHRDNDIVKIYETELEICTGECLVLKVLYPTENV